ncbi:MAG: GxxExxY protein [Planctomycetota bacterium]
MSADERRFASDQVTERIIGSAYRVSNALGVGFLEKVYENALRHELQKQGLNVQQQAPVSVVYDGVCVGEYFIDLLVEGVVVVELKHAKSLSDAHLAQCLNYLKATSKSLALLINFGNPRVEIRRVVHNH